MKKRISSQQIDDIAADWAARVDGRPLGPAEQTALDSWLADDPRHLGAYVKARAIALHTRRAVALGTQFDPAHFAAGPQQIVSRRRMLQWGAAAASLAALSAGGLVWRGLHRLGTEIGETRSVTLADGSIVTLNTASTVEITYSAEKRSVRLIDGEALFDVAKDPGRPFIVAVGETEVKAVGTSFTVATLPGRPVEVVVREGVVEVSGADRQTQPILRVPANMKAVAPQAEPATAHSMAPTEMNRAMAWRSGHVAFESDTLAEAAAEFARYSDTRIIIDDPAIAAETITGLYVSNDPVGFAKAVALAFDLKMRSRSGEIHLTR